MGGSPEYLVTGAGGAIGGVSSSVVELLTERGADVRALVHSDNERADALRALGAQVVVGDLTEPADVVSAMRGVRRMFFNMGVSSSYLEASAIVSAAARDNGGLDTVVNMSQMTVSEMTLTSSVESRQHRLHWLAERVLDWSGLPVVHVRPMVFIDNPLFTFLNAELVRERQTLALPFGDGETSPVAAADVAAVVATLLSEPQNHHRRIYELTGPDLLGIAGLAQSFARGLHQQVTGVDVAHDVWVEHTLIPAGLAPHVQQHIATMARLHRAGRYSRLTDDVEVVTGRPAVSVERYVSTHPQKFGAAPRS